MSGGVLGATLDLAHPPSITGYDTLLAVSAPHISSFVAFYRVKSYNNNINSNNNTTTDCWCVG